MKKCTKSRVAVLRRCIQSLGSQELASSCDTFTLILSLAYNLRLIGNEIVNFVFAMRNFGVAILISLRYGEIETIVRSPMRPSMQ
jgi:hypothetical protein